MKPMNSEYCFLFCWFVFMAVINMVYKSNLAAVFIIPKLSIPFDSVEELVDQNVIKFTTMLGGAVDAAATVSEGHMY